MEGEGNSTQVKSKFVSFRINESHLKKFNAMLKRKKLNRSELLRTFINNFLAQ
jgi:metal-responsive CopG/Arc/MetJ family transcriptional regulator